MVGTRPTERPARRQPADRSRISAAVATTRGRRLATAVLDLRVGLPDHFQRPRVAVLSIGEDPLGHLRRIAARRFDHQLTEPGVLLDEARLAPRREAEQ